MKGFLSRISLLALVVSMFAGISPAAASGVVVTVTPSSSSSSPQTVTVAWTGSAVYTTGTTITITTSPAFTAVTDGGTTDLDGDATPDGAITSTSTNSATYTIATSTTLTSNSLSLILTFPGTATNYSISVFTSNPVDFGSAFVYANGGNIVNVTASVPSSLSFSIRNSADTADTNSCALGTLTTGAVSLCSYRLRISTNAVSGFQATIRADHDLATGSATMTQIVDNANFAAGTEAYGIATTTGATAGGRNPVTGAYDQPVVESAIVGTTFNVDASPVPTSTSPVIISYSNSFDAASPPSLTNTTLITHGAAINGATPAGNYTQVVTYTVTATY